MADKNLNVKIRQRISTALEWSSANPQLLEGEIGVESDTNKLKIGKKGTDNNLLHWNDLEYIGSNTKTFVIDVPYKDYIDITQQSHYSKDYNFTINNQNIEPLLNNFLNNQVSMIIIKVINEQDNSLAGIDQLTFSSYTTTLAPMVFLEGGHINFSLLQGSTPTYQSIHCIMIFDQSHDEWSLGKVNWGTLVPYPPHDEQHQYILQGNTTDGWICGMPNLSWIKKEEVIGFKKYNRFNWKDNNLIKVPELTCYWDDILYTRINRQEWNERFLIDSSTDIQMNLFSDHGSTVYAAVQDTNNQTILYQFINNQIQQFNTINLPIIPDNYLFFSNNISEQESIFTIYNNNYYTIAIDNAATNLVIKQYNLQDNTLIITKTIPNFTEQSGVLIVDQSVYNHFIILSGPQGYLFDLTNFSLVKKFTHNELATTGCLNKDIFYSVVSDEAGLSILVEDLKAESVQSVINTIYDDTSFGCAPNLNDCAKGIINNLNPQRNEFYISLQPLVFGNNCNWTEYNFTANAENLQHGALTLYSTKTHNTNTKGVSGYGNIASDANNIYVLSNFAIKSNKGSLTNVYCINIWDQQFITTTEEDILARKLEDTVLKGGTQGQTLIKNSNKDWDFVWSDVSGPPGPPGPAGETHLKLGSVTSSPNHMTPRVEIGPLTENPETHKQEQIINFDFPVPFEILTADEYTQLATNDLLKQDVMYYIKNVDNTGNFSISVNAKDIKYNETENVWDHINNYETALTQNFNTFKEEVNTANNEFTTNITTSNTTFKEEVNTQIASVKDILGSLTADNCEILRKFALMLQVNYAAANNDANKITLDAHVVANTYDTKA